MRTRAAAPLLVVCACFAPSPPTGAPCDVAVPNCPAPQICVALLEGATCEISDEELPHVGEADGWTASVFHDFSEAFVFDANDFVEVSEMDAMTTEVFDNQPDSMFVLHAPFPEALAVIAGRVVFEVTAGGVVPHDFGDHDRDTPGEPDNLCAGTWVPDLSGQGPRLLLASSSLEAGDGAFRVTPAWKVQADTGVNNARGVLWDTTAAFGAGIPRMPTGYVGTQEGLVRRQPNGGNEPTLIVKGDYQTLRIVGSDLFGTRHGATSVQLVRITSALDSNMKEAFTVTILAERRMIELGEGAAPAPYVAWAILDAAQLVLVRDDGTFEPVARTADPAFVWHAAVAAPAPPHALAGDVPTVYVLESNRDADLDRVLIFAQPSP